MGDTGKTLRDDSDSLQNGGCSATQVVAGVGLEARFVVNAACDTACDTARGETSIQGVLLGGKATMPSRQVCHADFTYI